MEGELGAQQELVGGVEEGIAEAEICEIGAEIGAELGEIGAEIGELGERLELGRRPAEIAISDGRVEIEEMRMLAR